MTPRLSVVMVTWNVWSPHLPRCLQSWGAGTDPAVETIVVDNGSTDGTADHVRRQFPFVRLHVNEENLGYARGLNQGLTLAQGEYVLTLDADTELTPADLALLLEFLDDHPHIDVVAPRTYFGDGTVQESARRFPSAMSGIFGRQSLMTRLFPNNPFSYRYLARDFLTATDPFQVEQVSSACMLVRRKTLEEVGLFDELYHSYWADTDWCRRAAARGKKVFCLPAAAVIHHEHNRAGRRRSPIRIRLFHLDAFRYYRRHHTWGTLDPRALTAGLCLGGRALLQLLLNRRWAVLPAGSAPVPSSATPERPASVPQAVES